MPALSTNEGGVGAKWLRPHRAFISPTWAAAGAYFFRSIGRNVRYTRSAITCPRLQALLAHNRLPQVGVDMRAVLIATVVQLFVTGLPGSASAQSPANTTPGVVTEGSGNVSIGGVPAARKGDAASGEGSVAEGSSNVF